MAMPKGPRFSFHKFLILKNVIPFNRYCISDINILSNAAEVVERLPFITIYLNIVVWHNR